MAVPGLCYAVLGSKRCGLAVLLFLLLIGIGLPLLSGGRGGLGLFATPSAGFLIGWPIAAFVTGFIVEQWRSGPLAIVAGLASVIGGIAVLYVFGIFGMAITLDKTLIEATAIAAVYIPGDLIKAVIADMLTAALAKARPASVLSRVLETKTS